MTNEVVVDSIDTERNPRLMAIPELLEHNFFIPDYQRGYRWEKQQILQLIEDICSYFGDDANVDSFYCLQPIVVKQCPPETIAAYHLESKMDDGRWYEVIDGQQRLTTIRILLAFYFEVCQEDDRRPYRLAYATRPELGGLFDKLRIDRKTKAFHFENDDESTRRKTDRVYIENCISDVLGCFNHPEVSEPGKDFHLAYNRMNTFFENLLKSKMEKKSVQVLWYETHESCDARDIFERVNDLKIPLSNSELIRALFLSAGAKFAYDDSKAKDVPENVRKELSRLDKERKQLHIKSRWDEMEHHLRNDDFWSFLTNQRAEGVRNRIELLFDLMSGKRSKNKVDGLNKDDNLYTFLYFDRIVKSQEKDLWGLWKDVQAHYDRLRFWFEDNDCYHRIGYLVYLKGNGDEVLTTLLQKAKTVGRDKFNEEVVELIKKSGIPEATAIKTLSYEHTYDAIMSLLVLYNVETCRSVPVAGRFPFRKFKEIAAKPGWTLEHIHAQNSDCLDKNKKDEWCKWAQANVEALRNNSLARGRDDSLIVDLEAAVLRISRQDNAFTHNDITDLFDRVSRVYHVGRVPAVHRFDNMALLDGSVNSGIGKSEFEVKRQYIAKVDADGYYIPYCTRKVFLKYYYQENPASSQLLSRVAYSWDEGDRKAYLKDIAEKLSPYYPESAFAEEA